MTGSLEGRTVFISGGSRGIGKSIALRAAKDGAQVVIAAKTDKPHPSLPGTIHTAAAEIEAAGGRAQALKLDVRDDLAIRDAMEQAAARFGGIDILVNNASAITLKNTADLPMRRFDLMFSVNVRATFACSQACLPYLLKSANPHILNLAPPPNLDPKWFRDHTAYTISKYGMSLCTLGMAEEFRERGLAVNALWPLTVIATSAIKMLGDTVKAENCRTEEIMADAAHAIVSRNSRECTGNFFIDEDVLRHEGVTDFEPYAVKPGAPLMKDLFLD
jgi:citronellol/citronellal dehydrogenase